MKTGNNKINSMLSLMTDLITHIRGQRSYSTQHHLQTVDTEGYTRATNCSEHVLYSMSGFLSYMSIHKLMSCIRTECSFSSTFLCRWLLRGSILQNTTPASLPSISISSERRSFGITYYIPCFIMVDSVLNFHNYQFYRN